MKIIPVYLRDMQDAKHLVQAAEACKKEVDLLCGRYVVDAKSMLGVFSLPCFDDVKMRVEDEQGFSMDAVYFGEASAFCRRVSEGGKMDLVYYPSVNTYQGRENLQLVITHFR